jgi:hypothetical protein
MKKINILFLSITIFLVIVLQTGCIGLFFNGVTIRTEGNVSTVLPGGILKFTASDKDIIWTVSSTSDGNGRVTDGTSISEDGKLIVGDNEIFTTLYVIASPQKSGKSVFKQIRIVTVTGVTITYSNQPVVIGRTLQFRALVTGTNNPDNIVTWRVGSSAGGTGTVTQGTRIDSNGLLMVSANETLSTLYITAVSVVDPSKSDSISVSVVRPIVTSVVVGPSYQTVTAGRTFQFNASVLGVYDPDDFVTWRVSSNAAGTGAVTPGTSINANGLLRVAVNETLSVLYIIADSVVDPSKSGSVSVSVVIPTVTSVIVSPSNQSVVKGRFYQFNASVIGTNNPDPAVTWSVSSNAAGFGTVASGTGINPKGLLIVASNETASTLYIFATSVQDTSKSGSISVRVIIPTITGVTVSPSNQSITSGGSAQFYAKVNGANNPDTAVTWRVSSNAAGTGAVTSGTSISGNGLLRVAANETLTTLYVTAFSVTDPSKSGSVSVRVTVTAPKPAPTPSPSPKPVIPLPPSAPDSKPAPVTPAPSPKPDPVKPIPVPDRTPTVTGVVVSPSSQTTQTNRTVQFRASVSGNNNPSNTVTWKVSSTPNGTGAVAPRTTINSSGLLTVAPNEWSTVLYVIATSTADPSKSGTASVTISNNNENQGQNQGR